MLAWKLELAAEVKGWEDRQKEMVNEGFEFSAFLIDVSAIEMISNNIDCDSPIDNIHSVLPKDEIQNQEYATFFEDIKTMNEEYRSLDSSDSTFLFDQSIDDSYNSIDSYFEHNWMGSRNNNKIFCSEIQGIPSSIQVMSTTSIKSPMITVTNCEDLNVHQQITISGLNPKLKSLMASDPTQSSSKIAVIASPRVSTGVFLMDCLDSNENELSGSRIDSNNMQDLKVTSNEVHKNSKHLSTNQSTISRFNILREINKGLHKNSPTPNTPVSTKVTSSRNHNNFFATKPQIPSAKVNIVICNRLKNEVTAGTHE